MRSTSGGAFAPPEVLSTGAAGQSVSSPTVAIGGGLLQVAYAGADAVQVRRAHVG